MIIANKLSKLCQGAGLVAVLLLAGCAQNQLNQDTAPAAADTSNNSPEKTGEIRPAVAGSSKEEPAIASPVAIDFDKLRVTLDDSDKPILARVSDSAQKAPKITITGFCDRKQIGNAKAAAIARAVAVKNELIRLGIKPDVFRIKYVTEVANKHGVEIQF